MFTKEKTANQDRFNGTSATLISTGTELQGDLKSENDLRIDGTVHGNVMSTSKIIIGPNGVVEGNIEAAQADVMGKVIGNIAVNELLQLRGQCNVHGNLTAGKLQIEPTAVFNGQCKMSSEDAVVKLDKHVAAEEIKLYQ
ncbi:MAG: cell shape determination protein CcmA [Chitinophagaceae bacterium]